MGFEPTTFCLGSRHSTPELHPLLAVPILPTALLLLNRPETLSGLTGCASKEEARTRLQSAHNVDRGAIPGYSRPDWV